MAPGLMGRHLSSKWTDVKSSPRITFVPRTSELRTRQRQRLETRERLYLLAETEIRAHGLAGISIARIARTAGVSRQTFYDHFPTPESIVEEAFTRYRARLASELDRTDFANAEIDVTLHAVVDAMFAALDPQGGRIRLEISALLATRPKRSEWEEEPALRIVNDGLNRAELAATVDATHRAEEIAQLFLTAISGFLRFEGTDPIRFRQLAHATVDLLLAGLATEGRSNAGRINAHR